MSYWLNEFVQTCNVSLLQKLLRGDVVMVITIEQALHPLLLTFSILGFGVYFPKKAYLNIFYDVTIWTVYVCLLYYAAIEFKAEKLFFETSTIINVLISIFVIITSVIMNIYYNKVHTYIFAILRLINNKNSQIIILYSVKIVTLDN